MTAKELHSKLGKIIKAMPKIAESEVCIVDNNCDWSDMPDSCYLSDGILVSFDGDDPYVVIVSSDKQQ